MEPTSNAAPPSGATEEISGFDSFTAAIPSPYTILGLRLLPLSIGRYRRMKRFNVAFVAEKAASAEMSDLIMGVLICSMTCDDFDAFVSSPNFSKEVEAWGKRVAPTPFAARLGRKALSLWNTTKAAKRWREAHSFNFIEKMNLFKKYVEEAQVIPNYSLKENSPSSSKAHWSHSIEVVLRSELGWTKEEIDEQPLTKGLVDYFKFMENEGLLNINSDADIEQAKYNAERIRIAYTEGGLPCPV